MSELRATVLDGYRALSRGFDDVFLDGLDHDNRLVLLGVGPEDVVVGAPPSGAEILRPLVGEKIELVPKVFEVRMSADHSVAWIYDEISYRITKDGRRAVVPLRSTAVYERKDLRWTMVLAHVSYAITDVKVALGGNVATDDLGTLLVANPGDLSADDVRVALLSVLRDDDAESKKRLVSTEEDALFLGIEPEDERRGNSILEVASLRPLFGYDLSLRPLAIRAEVSRSKTMAWATAALSLEGARDDRPVRVPVRVTWVLRRQGAGWQVVQSHVSVPIPRDRLAAAVYGTD